MLLMIDNYDSFTYNVYQYLCDLGEKVKVVRNDKTSLAQIRRWAPAGIVISPGPGNPDGAGLTLDIIEEFAGDIPILGICLGHQSIAQAFGGKVVRAKKMMHGKLSEIRHNGRGLFKGLPKDLTVTRYHSLVVKPESMPSCLKVSAETDDGVIMAIKHTRYPVFGIQFHPESYMTQEGLKILENFCSHCQ